MSRRSNKIRLQYNIFILILLIIMCIICIGVSVCSIKQVREAYDQDTENIIIDLKKVFLKDTVNNIIWQIDEKKANEIAEYEDNNEIIAKALENSYHLSKQNFPSFAIDYMLNQEGYIVLIIDTVNNNIVYDNFIDNNKLNIEDNIDFIKKTTATYTDKSFYPYQIIYGVKTEHIDEITKNYIADILHKLQFANNTYIWVNEVIDYNGGDNYAIRRIHPNLVETEGMPLSTSMTDIKGNYPYFTELEGVKAKGEIFFSYYFLKKDSDITSQKLTYAKLYKDYDWIIAMGIHTDDVKQNLDKSRANTNHIINNMIIALVLFLLLAFSICIISITSLEKWYYTRSSRKLKKEANIDCLTNTYNRRLAVNNLNIMFQEYKKDKVSPAILLFDIDNFKLVNDNYGHDVGDYVLRMITKTIKDNVRYTDTLYRWGGEEFLLICDGLMEEHVMKFANNLKDAIKNIEYENLEEAFQVTISIGISYFKEDDQNIDEVIKRADIAMYQAKMQGKNRVCIYKD